MEFQKVFHYYSILESSPKDDLTILEANFIRLKKLYSHKNIYLPDKKLYLTEIDKAWLHLRSSHTEFKNPSIQEDMGDLSDAGQQKKAQIYQLYEELK